MPIVDRQMFDTALKYFVGDKYYKAERARTLFKKGQFLMLMDDTVNASATRQDAERLFYEIRPHHSGDRSKALGLTDFFPARYCFLEILISWYFDVAELRLVRLATRG
jgi:hypothetical protein